MTAAWILLGLVVIGIVAAVLIPRLTGPRPDAPLKGKQDDGPDAPHHREAAEQGATWESDRPGGPGAEATGAPTAGEPAPGEAHPDGRDPDTPR